jgi:anhydro-N-acetylmuramic acid kinase
MSDRAMIVAGIMSGTSADGIDVALVRVGSRSSTRKHGAFELLAHAEYPYPPPVRRAVLAAMNAGHAAVADLSRLNSLLGELYANALLRAQRHFRLQADLVGCHGQTLYHQGEPRLYLGKKIATTWQTGEAAVIAARAGVPVVSDFRPADIAAGGKGAPLVPYLDYLLFRDSAIGRIVLNIGGIANLTAIPPCAPAERVLAFDTGPGNMVIDQITEAFFGRPFDRNGKIAASGQVIDHVVKPLLKRDFFRKRPPKTAGREEFGSEFVREFLRRCKPARRQDVIATATALTARSIADAVRQFVIPSFGASNSRARIQRGRIQHEMIVSGGGARNATLVSMLREGLAPLRVQLRFSDEFGLPSQAKEAVAFAMLAYETWRRRPSNIPSATGAKRPAVLGKISHV